MKRIFTIILLIAFTMPMPVRASAVRELDPVESEYLTPPAAPKPAPVIAPVPKLTDEIKAKPVNDNDRLKDEFQAEKKAPASESEPAEKNTSNWWKWALGVLIVGGIAAAAGGGGGGGSGSSSGGSSGGSLVGTW